MSYGITFCVADCTNANCERNLNFVPIPDGLVISQADFSGNCPMYEVYEGGELEDYESEEELDFND